MPVLLPEERVGTTIAGKYRIDSILGRGGMGVVFAGHHEWTGREVAVKVLNAELLQYEDAVHRFMREARSAAQLTTPHVVDVLDMGREDEGTVYMVLERLKGESLEDRLERVEKMSLEDTFAALAPVMDALIEAHAAGIVHRDLKPDNIYLAEGPKGELVPKLLDFGIAKVSEASKNTKTGTMLGTPHYMSPEQVRGQSRNVGAAADIWSMGVVLFQCLSGELPYPGETTTGILMSILMDDPAQLAKANPELPPQVVELVHSALQRDPADRPGSMAALLLALQRLVDPLASVDTLRPPIDPMASTDMDARVTPPPESSTTGPLRVSAAEAQGGADTTPNPRPETTPSGHGQPVGETPAPFELVHSPATEAPRDSVAAVLPAGTPTPQELAKSGPDLRAAQRESLPPPPPPTSKTPLVVGLGIAAIALGSITGWIAISAAGTDPEPEVPVAAEPEAVDPVPAASEPPPGETAPVEPSAASTSVGATVEEAPPEPEPEPAAEPEPEPEPRARRRRRSSRRRAETPSEPTAPEPESPAVGANNAPILDLP